MVHLHALYSTESMRISWPHLTSHLVLVLLLLLTTACCHGAPSNHPHATKKLLRDAIVEYKIIVEYLTRLLHAAETNRPSTTTTTATATITTFPHSTVRHIPYSIKHHPFLSSHSSVPDASSQSTPLASTSSTSSPLPSEPASVVFSTSPKVSFTGTASSLLVPPTSILLVDPISLSSSMPSVNSTLLALTSPSTESSSITPMLSESTTFSSVSSKLPHSSRPVTSIASPSLVMHPHTNSSTSTASPSSRLAHPQTYSPTLTSLAGPILHSQTHSPISANETHNSPTYPLLSHSPPAPASQSSPNTSRGQEDAAEDNEGDEIRITSKEAVPFHSDSRNASEYRSKNLQNVLGDEEESLGGMSELGNSKEEDEKEQQGGINDDEIAVSDVDEQSRERFVGNRRKNDEKNVLDRKEVNAEKVSLHMKGGHEDEIVTEEEQEEESESSDESNEADKSTSEGLGGDKAWYKMKTQSEEEKSRTEMKDEAKLKHKKKRKKATLYNHKDDDDSLEIKKKIRGKLKHKDISERTSLMQKKTRVKEKDFDSTETEPQQIRKDETELDQDSMNTNPSEETHNNRHTPNTPTNHETKKHRRIKSKEKMLDSIPKIRSARHVLQMIRATTSEPPPHFCAKTTTKAMQGLCAQVFSALVGIKDVMREMTQEGVTREGVHTLQVRRETLGKVVEEAEADVTFPSVVQQKVFVSYLHQLEQTVVRAREQSETRLARGGGLTLVMLVALGVGGGLVLLCMLVALALVLARHRQVHREEVCRKIHTEHIPIQSFLNSGHTNPGMREDEPDTLHSESNPCSFSGQDLSCGRTQEAQRLPKGSSTLSSTCDSAAVTHTAADAHLITSVKHGGKGQFVHSDPNMQNHKG